jgi:hypothetical protein
MKSEVVLNCCSDSEILLAGGFQGSYVNLVEIYNIDSGITVTLFLFLINSF